MKNKCWECGAEGVDLEEHHPVPRLRGGKRTIALCSICHSKAHHRKKNMHISTLVKEGMAKRKKQGAVFGNPRIKETAIPAGLAVRKEKAKKLRASLEKSILKLT